VAPIFPLYVLGLGASYTLLGAVISIYGAVQMITQIPIGRLSDRLGRKPLMLLGLLSFALMPPFYIYAQDAYALIPIRIVGGLGASAVWPLAMALIIDKARRESRGSAMGWYNAAFYSALAVGPVVGGTLYDLLGLQAPFLLWSVLGLISVLVVLTRVSEPATQERLSQRSRPREPLMLPGYGSTFLACCGVVMWTGIVGGFNITMLPSFASQLGLSTIEVGLLYMDYAGASALANIYFGRAADRGRRRLLVFGGCLAGATSFALLSQAAGLESVLVLLALLGVGAGMSNPAAAAIIADSTTISRRGEIFGIFNTARMAGVVVGPLVAGLTADAYGVMGAIYSFIIIAFTITLATILVREPAPPKAI
jgi:DHA1 family multidrug resistance protein-like MFS transporter